MTPLNISIHWGYGQIFPFKRLMGLDACFDGESPGGADAFLCPLFKYSSLDGELTGGYVVWGQWVRWFGGLTCDFAGVFEVLFFWGD
jgi:hypothetical protein